MLSDASNVQGWNNLLSFVVNNTQTAFYRNKYAQAGFDYTTDFKSLDDIKKIPFVTKAELTAVPSEQLRFVPESEVRGLTATSGTTSGTSLLSFLAPSPLTQQIVTDEYVDHGTSMIMFPPLRAGSIMYYYQLRKQVAILGDIHNLPASCLMAAQAKVRTIMTTPTLAIILKKYIEAQPALVESLKYFRLAGEVLSPSKKAYIQSLYPNLSLFSIYGSSEVGRAASQCAELAKSTTEETLYHPNVQGFYFEIINPETGAVLPHQEKGELVITDFSNSGTPLIRYRTGDLACIIDKPCTCRVAGPRLSFYGRINRDSVRAGGFDIRRDMIEKPILALKHLIHPDYEIHVYEKYVQEKPIVRLVLHLSLHDGVLPTIENREEIVQTFTELLQFSPTLSFSQAKELGLFSPLELEFITFPKAAKTVEKIILH